MPTYEMPLLLKIMSKPDTVTALKRVANCIFNRGGFIRKIDNLGEQPTPNKMSAHDIPHRQASYFIFHFDMPPRKLEDLMEEYGRDIDIIRKRAYKTNVPVDVPCTWHEEMLPVPYRPEVQGLIETANKQKRKTKRQFAYNSGLSYYPFQR